MTTDWILRVVKRLFPEFEFTWLGREMKENLPLEMNFVHEASNAARVSYNFENVENTALYIPKVISATKRVLIMEFIEGWRVSDIESSARHGIDRNQVSQELTKIFSEQVYIQGFFHADPHLGVLEIPYESSNSDNTPGNLLIRPSGPYSRSPYNFEIVLLDHGGFQHHHSS